MIKPLQLFQFETLHLSCAFIFVEKSEHYCGIYIVLSTVK